MRAHTVKLRTQTASNPNIWTGVSAYVNKCVFKIYSGVIISGYFSRVVCCKENGEGKGPILKMVKRENCANVEN